MTYDSTKYKPISSNYKGDKGDGGSPGSMAWHGAWEAGHEYAANELVSHPKTGSGDGVYICTVGHTSSAGAGGNEPEVATAWEDFWDPYSPGGTKGTPGLIASPVDGYEIHKADWFGTLVRNPMRLAEWIPNILD